MDIVIEKLSYVKGHRFFLKDISCHLKRRKVTVIVGPSGSGKSTLMALIGKRGIGGTKSGEITYGNATSKNRRVAYCPPVDVHIEYFTVMQSLYYSCLLRNSSKMLSQKQCTKECLRVATAVGLEKALDKVVGSSSVTGTSRGERRLLSIATELLGIPFALCLDDPMSGLDSEAALRVACVLSSLASHENKTVLCSLHYPSKEILYQSNWQDILFLSAGSVVYCGPIHTLEGYLMKLSLYSFPSIVPAESVPSAVEYVLELLGKRDTSDMLFTHWQSPANRQWVDLQSIDVAVTVDLTPISPDDKEDKEGIDDIPHKVWYEIIVVSVRHFMYKFHALEGGIRTIIGRYVLSGVLFGITFQNTGKQMEDLDSVFKYEDANFYNASYNMLSIEFCMCCFIVVSCCLSIAEMYHMREFFEREARGKLYRPVARWLSILTVDIPTLAVGAALYTYVVILLVKPMGSHEMYYLLIILSTLISFGYAYLCVELTRSVEMATMLYGVCIALCIWFAGFSEKRPNMLHWLRWGCDVDFMYYTIGQLMVNEFKDFNANSRTGDQGEKLLDYYAYGNLNRTECLINLVINLCVVLVGVLVAVSIPYYSARVRTVKEITLSTSHTSDSGKEGKHSKHGRRVRHSFNMGGPTDDSSLDSSLLSISPSDDNTAPSQLVDLPTLLLPDMALRYSSTYHTMGPRGTHFRASVPSIERFTALTDQTGRDRFFLPESKRVTLSFENVSYVVKPSLKDKLLGAADKTILKDVSGILRPGELWAVIGANGAGKTTLLNVLAGRGVSGTVYGDITVNGKHFKGIGAATKNGEAGNPTYGFVPQTDILCDVLTVLETLSYAAMLRLKKTDPAEVQEAVYRVLELLDLVEVADCFVGSEAEPVLSGSEMRRVAIGCELITMASILFCLDPVRSLDPYLSITVVDALKSLTRSFHTVICTLQHPGASVFSKFDKVMVIHSGYLVYSGPTDQCAIYMQEHTSNAYDLSDKNLNPVEFVLKVLADLPLEKDPVFSDVPSVAKLAELVQESSVHTFNNRATEYTYDTERTGGEWLFEGLEDFMALFQVQLKREMLQETRRMRYWIACFVRSIFLSSILGVVFYQQPRGEIYGRVACLLQVFVVGCVWMMEVLPAMHVDKLRFIHERDVHATTTLTAGLATSLPKAFLLIVEAICFGFPVYFFGGYRDGLSYVYVYLLVLYLSMLLNMFMAHLVCLLSPSSRTSIVVYSGIVGLQSFYCGYSVLIPTLGWWFRWAAISNPGTFAMNAWYWNEFLHNEFALGDVNFQKYSEMFGWTTNLTNSILYLVLIVCVHKLLCLVAMKNLTSRSL